MIPLGGININGRSLGHFKRQLALSIREYSSCLSE